MTAADWGLILLLSAIWAWSYVFNRFALEDLPVMTVVLGRVGIAAIVLAPLALMTGGRLPGTLRLWLIMMGMSILNNIIPFSLIVVGFVGLVVLIGPAALAGLGDQIQGQLLLLGAAVSYAVAAVYGRRMLKGIAPMTAACGQLICSTVIILPVAAVVDQPWTYSPGWLAWASILGISIICTAFAYILYFRILASAGSTNLLLVTFLVPAGAVLVGWLVADEVITWAMLAGMALILAGLAIMDGRVLRRWAPHRPV